MGEIRRMQLEYMTDRWIAGSIQFDELQQMIKNYGRAHYIAVIALKLTNAARPRRSKFHDFQEYAEVVRSLLRNALV